ncbi:ribosomal l29e domain-containing protein [Rhizoctonia solani AG-1 IA]|uniref:60S ribosomal protein L29 n=1 Tax=Thanatephorus cucumeris (strain AG1-IA) TaxID=983506 RepID=L8X9K3_THACA|nr:ribosomal l29e domain-containing protein [Rhizoctonia solani AG-1 IA]
MDLLPSNSASGRKQLSDRKISPPSSPLLTTNEMAKSKKCEFHSHTNHNQNKKAHRNGIKKPKTHYAGSMKGFRRNQKYARLGTQKALAAKKAEAAA